MHLDTSLHNEKGTLRYEKHLPVDYAKLAPFFDNLIIDPYLVEDAPYRLRRIGFFDIQGDDLIKKSNRGFIQNNENTLVGKIERNFDELEDEMIALEDFKHLVFSFVNMTGLSRDIVENSELEVHQVRIQTTQESVGQPAPEGMHQDGTDIGCIYCVAKENVREDSAETLIAQSKDGDPIFVGTLEPGEILVVDDRELWHYTSPVVAKNPLGKASRDVFLMSLTRY